MFEKFGSRNGAWALPLVLACAPVMAADPGAAADTLAQSSGCLSCHAKAEKIVGPAFVSIADKYKGDKDAVASLTQSIQNGSRGKWGRVPMPAHHSLSQADLKTLAQWVLSTKP